MAEFFDAVDKSQDYISNFHKQHLNEAFTGYEKIFSNLNDVQDALTILKARIFESNEAAEVGDLSHLRYSWTDTK